MHTLLNGNGELPLLCNDNKVVAFESFEQWKVDQLIGDIEDETLTQANKNLQSVDCIVWDWLKQLTPEEWAKINRQESLFGIKLPAQWVKVWRVILKDPRLRDSKTASRNGRAISSYTYIWNIWSEDCIKKYLSDMEKDLLRMVDMGLLYSEIGDIMMQRYGDQFWKPRKINTKTTPSQVVNNYLYWAMPNRIVRGELTDIVLRLSRAKKRNKTPS